MYFILYSNYKSMGYVLRASKRSPDPKNYTAPGTASPDFEISGSTTVLCHKKVNKMLIKCDTQKIEN